MIAMGVEFGGAELWLDARRALWWPEEKTLAVADLHLGKAAAFRAEGLFIPPYDTRATLAKLQILLAHYRPKRLLSVGDSFHRKEADALLDPSERADLLLMLGGVQEWVWITGNHDPLPPDLPGIAMPLYTCHGLTFAHQVQDAPDAAHLLCGHYHPKASVSLGRGKLRRPCFAWSETRMMLPAFGSLSGGMDITGPTIAPFLGDNYDVLLCDLPKALVIGHTDLAYSPA